MKPPTRAVQPESPIDHRAPSSAGQAVTLADIRAAAQRIAPHAHRTPVLTSAQLDALAGRRLLFKCENLQRVGAFKFRGACNAILKLPAGEAQRGVVTHSSGNHAQAVALAARIRGIPAHVVMPSRAAAVKQRAVRGYGGRIILCEPNQQAREAAAAQVARETGAVLIPPYNHPDIIAGQGTAALELLEETGPLDAVLAPVGGGGLVSGTAIAASGLFPGPLRVRVFAGEPAGADDAARSKQAGRLLPAASPSTIADGLLTGLGDLTWPVVRDLVERVFTVTDEEIIAAMRLLMERMKIVVEPSGAVPLAAVLSDAFRAHAEGVRSIGIILSGGNVDLDHLPWR
jgi:threonine dehydratase/serine racemase